MARVDLAARFRAARLLAELSVREAAEQLEISAATLERYERGEKTIPAPYLDWARNHWIPPDGMPHPLDG